MSKPILNSGNELRELIKRLIETEDKSQPLSDSQLHALAQTATKKKMSYQAIVWHRRQIAPRSSIRGNFVTPQEFADQVAALIENESHDNPLSDAELADKLGANIYRILRARDKRGIECRTKRLEQYRSDENE